MIYHRNFAPEIDRQLLETFFLPLVWVSAAKFDQGLCSALLSRYAFFIVIVRCWVLPCFLMVFARLGFAMLSYGV